ncbi:FtsB family cell division protein [Gelidibacter salicanalis]|uniref:Septum formation initiator family protein n=1 Tax=Gelidibacter salicanalis TaxID=291193 RepID=A0A934KN89_9FLAO|nr:septum formation initiator family protein [Gelidibacter salicanalis]MBJ7880819.1 septum formation initiator family protein [Gelidibacter salicanalis]
MYVLIFVVFAGWMLFFDANSYLIHRELNSEMDDLEEARDHYKREIKKDEKAIKAISTEEGLERLAREKYYMKRENEEIYIIEYEDSIRNQKEYD